MYMFKKNIPFWVLTVKSVCWLEGDATGMAVTYGVIQNKTSVVYVMY